MNIGEKIRSLRVAKLMTQSELAGNQITRNMLSCIEHGTAQPSLSTILYIAGRLNVPVGFLLAEEGDEIAYQKMNNLANIKRAYKAGDLTGCRSLCLSACPDPDDEIRMLLANCDAEIGKSMFWKGSLKLACRYFDEALLYASETLYPMPHIRSEISVYFQYMSWLSPSLFSNVLDENEPLTFVCKDSFSLYVDALLNLENGNEEPADSFIAQHSEAPGFFSQHLNVRCCMKKQKYREGKTALLEMIGSQSALNEVELYSVLNDLEVCCRETGDFEGAYRYTNERMQLLQRLLNET